MKNIFLKLEAGLRAIINNQSWLKSILKALGAGWIVFQIKKMLIKQEEVFSKLKQDECCLIVPLSYQINVQMDPLPKIAVICHMFYTDLVEEFQGYFLHIPYSFDLYMTTDTDEKKLFIQEKFSKWEKGKVIIRIAPNRGRDIAPKLITCKDVYDQYEYILHVHTKKSLHAAYLSGWRQYILNTLLGSPEIVKSIFEAFYADEKLGMIAPQHHESIKKGPFWGGNYDKSLKFAKRIGDTFLKEKQLDFPSGSMFWARSAALKPLLECDLSLDDFDDENKQVDGTLAHVIERLYFFICENAGYRWIKIIQAQFYSTDLKPQDIKNRDDLRNFIKNQQLLAKNS